MSRIPRAVIEEVHERAAEHCEGCGWPRLERVTEHHHRDARGMGGTTGRNLDVAPNIVALHGWCHRWVHAHPEEATAYGLIVPDGGDFTVVPFRVVPRMQRLFAPSWN